MKNFDLNTFLKKMTKKLFRYSNRIWFSPLLFLLALLDAFILVIPTDGILISSSMIAKRKWPIFGISVAIGSAIGAFLIVWGVEVYGMEIILKFFPKITETLVWIKTEEFFKQYGLFVLFFVGITPFSQQPALILAALSKGAFLPIFIIILVSRVIKFLIMSYIASHTPKLLNKLWGISKDMKDAGIQIKN